MNKNLGYTGYWAERRFGFDKCRYKVQEGIFEIFRAIRGVFGMLVRRFALISGFQPNLISLIKL
ncbi:Putative protein [Zobellia galactanivorans]|uniref:Uncharacterized protein n=1 Tax=Zobellia galactanivorans (strain DSM 12802 / CCUG 47099 / CIP 106680 / NCIMB 13871 / Dsij) TaxID=63186 RepID=G0L0P3_ZOBGA|nr:Putative protein [Zobellia galactanivorans]